MQHDLKTRYSCNRADHALLMGLQRISRHGVGPYLKQRAGT
jgi:DNA polymerase-3 subunit epsilon